MTPPLTDQQIADMRAREAAAFDGPWFTDSLDEHDGSTSIGVATEGDAFVIELGDLDPADAEFIAHARADVPALLDEVERLRSAARSVERYRIAWRMARTRALSTGGAADRYAARAREMQTALQETVFAVIGMQMERDAARVKTLTEISGRLASRATLYGDSTTVNRIIKDLLNLADEQPGKGTGGGTQPPAGEPTQDADFFQPGHTYRRTDPEWAFRCDTVTTHPDDGERTALGWRYFNGRWAEYAYGPDDWEIAQLDGDWDAVERGDAS